jgi:RecB family exonuclease
MERAEECPLDWVIGSLGGGASTVSMSLGTLVHHAFETAQGHDVQELLEKIESEWRKLPFDADWESERMRGTAAAMAAGLASYLREFDGSDRELVGRETGFSVPLGRAELRGKVDRVESRLGATGTEVTVVDLKTGAKPPSGPETQRHAQLQAYQLATALGAFTDGIGPEGTVSGGARLLFVHPEATKGGGFVERAQAPLDDEARSEFAQRVAEIAEVMAASSFTARVEHHCSDAFSPGDCRIHIVPAVSRS